MAAQVTTLKRLRLSKWMTMGMATAPATAAAAARGVPKKKANKGMIGALRKQ
jgi:hypothetical protein